MIVFSEFRHNAAGPTLFAHIRAKDYRYLGLTEDINMARQLQNLNCGRLDGKPILYSRDASGSLASPSYEY